MGGSRRREQGRGGLAFVVLGLLGAASLAGCLSGQSKSVGDQGFGAGTLQQTQSDAPLLNGTGALKGAVMNENGAPLNAAHITVLTTRFYTDTDKDGRFSFASLAPGVYTLRTDRKEYDSLEDQVTISLDKVTEVTITLFSPTGSSVGFRDHVHDFWGDQTLLTIFDGKVEQVPSTAEGGTQTPYACANQNPGTGGVNGDSGYGCYVINVPVEEGKLVPPGTKELHVSVKWDANQYVKKVDLKWAPANSTGLRTIAGLDSGTAVAVPVTDGMNDNGHAKFTSWNFQLFQYPEIAPGYRAANDQFNAKMLPTYKVTIHAVKGVLYPEPAHARFWQTGGRLVLMEHGMMNITGVPTPRARDPKVVQCGNVQCFNLKDKVIVPPGTTQLDVTLEWAYGANCPASAFDQKSLSFRTAEGNPQRATLAGLRVEPGEYSGQKVTYHVKVKDVEPDAFYQKKSNWIFFISHKGQEHADKYQPDCPDGALGGDHFFLHVEAINENWAADHAAGRV